MEKQLGWAHKLVGQRFWRYPRWLSVSWVDGFLNMAPTCQLCDSVWGGFRKGTMASACLDARHFSFSLDATRAFQDATMVLELSGSASE